MSPKHRIVVVGGGFAGVKCAKKLHSLLPRDQYDIVMFNRENHMVFHPLLAELVAGVIQTRHLAAPIRQLLKGVHCRTEEVVGIDLPNSRIEYLADDGRQAYLSYDQLVIAHGNTVNLAIIPGMSDHSYPLKTIGDAIALQSRIMDCLERADVCDVVERKRDYLSFIVVGGGFSGVEVAGELNELVRSNMHFYSKIKESDVTVTLVHAGDEILPEVNSSLREFARSKMEKAGIKVLLNAAAKVCTQDGIILTDGSHLNAATVVCTIGTRSLPMIDRINLPKDRGRLITEPDMSLPGYPNAWAIGDCAAVKNAHDNLYAPPTAQFAEREGSQVAHNIAQRLNGQPTKPFSHKSLGSLCSIGGMNAVAEIFGMRFSGFIAWFIWRGVYLMKLPSFAQQAKVGIEWLFDLIFPRQLAYLKADTTQRIGHAYYPAGDYIFHAGDVASDFYVVEHGEVEVLRELEGGRLETIAVLGPGDFFGEAALVDHRPRSATCRARTNAEIIVVGRSVFEKISSALSPLKTAIAQSIRNRREIREDLPEIHRLLATLSLSQFIEQVPGDCLKADAFMKDAISRINNQRLDSCYVVDNNEKLCGIVTRSDLIRAFEVTAAVPTERRYAIRVKDLLIREPIMLTSSDTVLFAVTTMKAQGLKTLPVVDNKANQTLQGYVRFENILAHVLEQLSHDTSQARTAQLTISKGSLKKGNDE